MTDEHPKPDWEPRNAMPVGENAGPVRWDGEHYRQIVKTNIGVSVDAVVD